MKPTLSLVFLFLAMQSFSMEANLKKYYSDSTQLQELKYSYIIETDLSAGEFSEVFCQRLSTKYNWHKVYTISEDDTYISLLTFDNGTKIPWVCEVIIRKIENETDKMYIEMIMDSYSESLPFF